MYLKVNGTTGIACADTGATHSIAGEMLFKLLQEQGVLFKKTTLQVMLADRLQEDPNILNAKISVEIEGHVTIFALPPC